jgi:hypothetical protein
MANKAIRWLNRPAKHNYPAAASYLALLYGERKVARLVKRLRHAGIIPFKAKDIFRASALSRLGVSNLHVKSDQQKIRAGTALSPILLVRDQKRGRVIIADGYHRLCAVYSFNEDADIPCQIV